MSRGLRIRGCVKLRLDSPRKAESIARSLAVEAVNPPDEERGSVSVRAENTTVYICFEARDPSSARAILNAFLGLAAATIEALSRLGEAA